MADNKNIVRQEIKFKREMLLPGFVSEASAKIADSFMSLDCVTSADSFLLYADFKNEVSTGDLIARLLMAGKKVYLPKVYGEDLLIGGFSLKNCTKNKFGIIEPDVFPEESVPAEKMDIFVVPGIAFDRKGGRIGFGRGYYDRLLSANEKGVKIAVAYDMQIVDDAFSEEFDIGMDIIVTEKEIIKVGRI